MSCDGMYADIERVEDAIVVAQAGGETEQGDALQLLLKEYEDHKKKYTESLIFNMNESSSNYGGYSQSFSCKI